MRTAILKRSIVAGLLAAGNRSPEHAGGRRPGRRWFYPPS